MNPLIDFPATPHQALAFDRIDPEHFLPALEHWIPRLMSLAILDFSRNESGVGWVGESLHLRLLYVPFCV